MKTRAVNSAAGVILAALTQNRTAAGIALALESAGMLAVPPAPNDPLAKVRNTAFQELLRDTGERRPMWRVIITDSESPTGLAPVCAGERSNALHMIDDYPGGPQRDEDGVYDCCPYPQIETYSTVWAEYLAGLLNAEASDELTGAYLARWEEEQDNARLRLALKSAQRGRQEARDRIAELEAQRERRRVRLVGLQNDALNMRGVLSPNGEPRKVPMPLGDTLTPAVTWLVGRVAELEAERSIVAGALLDTASQSAALETRLAGVEPTPFNLGAGFTVFRASHESIPMGLYTTREAAREHCETLTRRDISDGTLGWVPDDGSDHAPEELSVFGPGGDDDGPDETCTGYVVTALTVASEYDPDADE